MKRSIDLAGDPSRAVLSSLLVLLVLAFAGEALGQDPGQERPIRPGDVIRVTIWREPDLSGEFPIHEDGTVVLPRVGTYRAAGQSPQSLRESLVEEYSETLRNPSIDIVALQRVTIIGQVGNPGVYTVDPTMTVSDAIAMAGGPQASANKEKIILVRDGQEREIELDEQYTVVDLRLQSGDQLYIPEGSWLRRNIPLVSSIVGLTAALLALLAR